MLVTLTPLSVMLVVFHELTKVPRLLDCQQKVPAPSKVKGAVMVDVTGLQVPPPEVGVAVGGTEVKVRVGVRVIAGGVKVRVGVLVGPLKVAVRVGVLVGPLKVAVRVGVDVTTSGVFVRVGVFVTAGIAVRVAVELVPPAGVRGIFATPEAALVTILSSYTTFPVAVPWLPVV